LQAPWIPKSIEYSTGSFLNTISIIRILKRIISFDFFNFKYFLFEIGNKVLPKDVKKEKTMIRKIKFKMKGSYYIHKIIKKEAYKFRILDEKVLKASYNIKYLKKYYDQRDTIPRIFV
jgi:hypothetical protein